MYMHVEVKTPANTNSMFITENLLCSPPEFRKNWHLVFFNFLSGVKNNLRLFVISLGE